MTGHSSPKRNRPYTRRRATGDDPNGHDLLSLPQRICGYTPGRRLHLAATKRARWDWRARCDRDLPAAECLLIGRLQALREFCERLHLLFIAAFGIDLET